MSYIATVTVPAGKVASTLTNFVTRVDLSHMPSGWWADVSAGGANIRVKSGGSLIPFDLIWIDTTLHTGVLFFKSTLTTGANDFTVETVTGATALAATDTNGQYACWSDYAVVVDYKSNRTSGATPVEVGTVTNEADGWMRFQPAASGQANRCLYVTGLPMLTTWTMGISTISEDVTATNKAAASYTLQGSTSNSFRETIVDDAGDTRGVWNSTDSWRYQGSRVYGAVERRVIVHQTTSQLLVYRDGTLVQTDTTVAQRPSGGSTGEFIAGAGTRSASESWQGLLRFAYIRSGALSADWLAAEATSWESPASFYTVTDTGSPTNPSGTISGVLPPLSGALVGTSVPPPVTGSITATLPDLSSSLIGESYPPGVAGDLTATLPPLAANLTGTYSDAATLAAVLPPLTAAFAGTVLPPPSTGTLAATLPALAAAFEGQAFEPGVGGFLAARLPALSASMSGVVLSRVGLGLILDSSATVSADAPLDPLPTPAGAPATTQRIVATSVPVPTLVAGRPQ